jgi:hypothetical protein
VGLALCAAASGVVVGSAVGAIVGAYTTVYLPAAAGSGAAEPTGQYTCAPPQAICVGLTEPGGQ